METYLCPGSIVTVLCNGSKYQAIVLSTSLDQKTILGYFEHITDEILKKYSTRADNSYDIRFLIPFSDLDPESDIIPPQRDFHPSSVIGKNVYVLRENQIGTIVSIQTIWGRGIDYTLGDVDSYRQYTRMAIPMDARRYEVEYYVHIPGWFSIEPLCCHEYDFVILDFPPKKPRPANPDQKVNYGIFHRLFQSVKKQKTEG